MKTIQKLRLDEHQFNPSKQAIAALPDLIQAAYKALDYFETVPEREIEASSEAYQAIQAALAKATSNE